MPIKHLVIAGGGPLGFTFLGALEAFNLANIWERENIESIYATSIGAIVGAFICLNHDWDTLNKYVIERPWKDVFKLSARQLFDVYYAKGLFGPSTIEAILSPLLKSKDLVPTITLKEFYEFSGVDFHLLTFNLNTFKVVELSHTSHPALSLVQALTMSSALPGAFSPCFLDDGCFLDGGCLCNYPVNQCVRDHPNKDEILGINRNSVRHVPKKNNQVSSESSILEYLVALSVNTMNYVSSTVVNEVLSHELNIVDTIDALSVETIESAIRDADFRRELFNNGEQVAAEYLQSQK